MYVCMYVNVHMYVNPSYEKIFMENGFSYPGEVTGLKKTPNSDLIYDRYSYVIRLSKKCGRFTTINKSPE